MSEAKKFAMATDGFTSGGVSSARAYVRIADRINNYCPRHCSGRPQTLTEFFGKTTEMNLKIFDVLSEQGARLLSTQDDLYECVSRNNLKGNQSANAIKDLMPITYTESPDMTFKDEASIDLSDIK